MAFKNNRKLRILPTKYEAGFLDRMDMRTEVARTLQIAFDQIVEDIGGADGLGHLKLALVERAVFLEFKLREWEQAMLAGKLKDNQIGRWIQAVNSFNGLCKMLGYQEVTKGDFLDALYSEPKTPKTDEDTDDDKQKPKKGPKNARK